MDVRFRPLSTYPGLRTPREERKPNPFKAGWSETLRLLQHELRLLDGEQIVIEVDLAENQIRNDGWPRARALPDDDAVVLSFTSKFGPLRYATDRFHGTSYRTLAGYQANLRAIALGLEALRKVDRYGITKRGEQYTGWKALTAGGSEPSPDPEGVILAWASLGESVTWASLQADQRRTAVRLAKRNAHPDAGGSDEAFVSVSQAATTLGF